MLRVRRAARLLSVSATRFIAYRCEPVHDVTVDTAINKPRLDRHKRLTPFLQRSFYACI